MRVLVYVLLGLAAIATVLPFLGFNVDLAIASLFYEPAIPGFPAEWNPYLIKLRDLGVVPVATCIGIALLAMLRLLPWRLPSVRFRTALFLTLSLLLGPGLLVNGILKPHWGRPRPIEVTQFGGKLPYVEWWNPSGACDSNCSFASGEAATAAWMFGPAMIVPPPWRALAIAAAAVFTVTMSGIRLAMGGHFFTDALLGALSTILILLAMQKLIGGPATAPGIQRNSSRSADEGVSSSV